MIHTMTPLEKLVLARAIIEEPESWTKGSYARDVDKWPVLEDDPSAVCFCASGAIRLACANTSLLHCALPLGVEMCVSQFNDCMATTHADVLAVFDRAIDQILINEELFKM